VVSRMLLLTKVGGGKPPFLTCKLVGAESFDSMNAYLQVGKGGLPPLTLGGFNVGFLIHLSRGAIHSFKSKSRSAGSVTKHESPMARPSGSSTRASS
jgi:hypothetical protein